VKWSRSPNCCRGGLLLALLLVQPAPAKEPKELIWVAEGGSNWVAFSPEGGAVWSSTYGSGGMIYIHDVRNGVKAGSDALQEGNRVAVGRKNVCAVGGAVPGIILYQWQRGDTFQRGRNTVGEKDTRVVSLAFDKDCKYRLSTHEGGNVNLWEVSGPRAGQKIALGAHVKEVLCGALSGDGKWAVTGGIDNVVQVWDCAKKKRLHRLTAHKDKIWSVAITRDGKLALSGSEDKTARVWNVETGKELKLDTGFPVYGVALSPDGKRGLVAGGEGKIVLYDLGTGKKLKSFISGDESAVNSVAISPDGKVAVSSSHNQKLRLWKLP